MKVRFLDLTVTDKHEYNVLLDSFSKVLHHGQLVMGPEVEEFEKSIADYCGRKFAISVGSGTDALYLGLRSLDIGTGDEVITTSLSWIATANAIAITGATPVFADIKNDLSIDPLGIEPLITKKTKAILVVDYTGKICDMDGVRSIADKYNLHLIEDGSQSFGAEYKGKKCGSFGVLSAISHNPMKVFAATGEAGTILCDDEKIYTRLVSLRYNGTVNREICVEPSLNGRMDTIQASALLERLKLLSSVIEPRRKNAQFYDKKLSKYVITPPPSPDSKDVFYTYTIRSSKRNELKDYLEKNGIETKIQHPLLMPQQPAYKNNVKGRFINAEKIINEVLCIPVHEKLSQSQLSYVVKKIIEFGDTRP